MTVKNNILKHLKWIEYFYGVNILYSCESGSRAWGFASEDSDYDVRFIYRRYLDSYLTVDDLKDTLDSKDGNNNIEYHGWDLKKALNLTVQGNASIREWLNSPVVYSVNGRFLRAYDRILAQYSNLLPIQFHYYGLAKNTWHKYIDFSTPVIAKKYLYAIRPVLCGLWIRRYNEFPPLDINELLSIAPYTIKQSTLSIIERKQNSEAEEIERIGAVDYFLLNGMVEISPENSEKPRRRQSYATANDFFYDWVKNWRHND